MYYQQQKFHYRHISHRFDFVNLTETCTSWLKSCKFMCLSKVNYPETWQITELEDIFWDIVRLQNTFWGTNILLNCIFVGKYFSTVNIFSMVAKSVLAITLSSPADIILIFRCLRNPHSWCFADTNYQDASYRSPSAWSLNIAAIM